MFEVLNGFCEGCGTPVQTIQTYGRPIFKCKDCRVKEAVNKIKTEREDFADPDNLYSEMDVIISALRDWGYTLAKE